MNPRVLAWARETAGLSLEEAARKIGVGDAYGRSAAERLAELETGIEEPSRALLEQMAAKYRRPLVIFYLTAPPPRGNRGQDFRTVTEVDETEAPLVDALLREVHARQGLIRSALEIADQAEHHDYVGSVRLEEGPRTLVVRMRTLLDLQPQDIWAASEPAAALRILRQRIEDIGVFALIVGDLGSHHTSISVDSFRGFALADPAAPVVVVNSNDSKTAQCFTLLHEFAHILLGETGISDYTAANRFERICNDAASEFLLPQAELHTLNIDREADFEDTVAAINMFATQRNVSRSMVAYKLYRANRLNRHEWFELKNHFRQLWLDQRETRRRRDKRKEGGGPSYYVTKRYSAGPALIDATARLLKEGALSTAKASQVLGVRPTQLGQLLELPGARA